MNFRLWLGLCALAGISCNHQVSTIASVKTDPGYVDAATCATCHAEIAANYRKTGMGRSFYRPSPSNRVEDFSKRNTLFNRASNRYYTMTERDGKLYQRRHQISPEGKETNVVEVSMDYVIGSGNHARTYLHRSPEGKLLEMPVSWYPENGGYWAMSPGYDRSDHQDFRRPVGYDCMFCHNSYPDVTQVSDPGSDEPLYGAKMPEGIDCQRCHGPGKAHVQAASKSGEKAEVIRAAIVNPKKLSRELQLDVCRQCHMETTSLRLPNAIRRFDRAPFSYRPGEPLSGYELLFDHAPNSGADEDRFEVAHAAYRLEKSACFRSSQMTCITCHDPHKRETPEHFNQVCGTCHATVHAAKSQGPDCITCHMWKRRAEDAVHLSVTDHFIQRRKPGRNLLAPLAESAPPYKGKVVSYGTLADPLYLATAQTLHSSNLDAGIQDLEQAIASEKPTGPEFHTELGAALVRQGHPDTATKWFEEAVRRKPDHRPALSKLAAAYLTTGQPARAIEVGEKAAAIEPPDTFALTDLANAYLQQNRAEDAQRLLQKALALDPQLPEAHNLMGLAWLRKSDPAQGEAAFREALRHQPEHAEANANLASLLAGKKDYARADYHFRLALNANPQAAETHHSYGFLLTLMNRLEPALAEFETALRLAPGNAQTLIDLADLLVSRRQPQQAETEYRKALAITPANAEAHLALARLLARRGNTVEARDHYQKAAMSQDPELREEALKSLR